jgi:ribonuclease J
VPGSYGFIVESEKGCIVYTGDFRMHSTGREKTLKFLEKAKEANPEVLLVEGTHVSECKLEGEEDVREKVGKIVSNTKKLVLAGFATADVDRMKTFYEVAKEHDRKLAISTKQAYILDALCRHEELELFSPADPNVLIFQREKKRYGQYEKEIQEQYSNVVNAKDIPLMQQEVILVASLYDMNEVAEIRPEAGSSYILSQSEPFDEEMEISYEKLLNWLSYLGIPLYQAHASGHATPHELKHVIAEISPKKVVPIHTERPELFKRFVSDLRVKVIIPSEGNRFELFNGD